MKEDPISVSGLALTMAQSSGEDVPFLFLGDHAALDFLNTLYRTSGGALVDALQSGGDVLRWLKAAGFPAEANLDTGERMALVKMARSLREAVRMLVEARKAGRKVPEAALNELNATLARTRSYRRLVPRKKSFLELERKWKQSTPEETLAPLAEAAAELLAEEDFDLVRHCEGSECVLWFYDRTKSHHRRWCSMAACGNRNKVAAFRRRQQEA